MERRRNRLFLILILAIFLMSALIYRLFTLTLVNGKEYKDYVENKVTRDIEITAARGNIYDRKGRLLAGTKSSYIVKIYKDDLMRLDKEERSKYILELVKYLEDDGASYLEEGSIGINKFQYKKITDYDNESINRRVSNIIKDNNLIEEFILSNYEHKGEIDFNHSIVDDILKQLEKKNIKLPIIVNPLGDRVELSYENSKDFEKFKEEGRLNLFYYLSEDDRKGKNDKELSPIELLLYNIKSNDSIILNLLAHPINRKIAYDLLKDKGLDYGIELRDMVFNDDLSFVINKGKLINTYKGISMDTSPKEDFYQIVYDSSLKEFLEGIYIDDEYNINIPGQALIDGLKELGTDPGVKLEVDKKTERVSYEYEDEDIKLGTESPLTRLIDLGKEKGLFRDLILDEKYKNVAQKAIFENGIYPNISISDWKYIFTKNKDLLLERYKLDKDVSPMEAFEKIREDNGIDFSNIYDNYFTNSILEAVKSQGYYAYSPYKLAYGLSDTCVAKISESIDKKAGIEVALEPIRYYPYNNLASHALGYVGRISQDYEIKKYIEEKSYDPSDIIGKTGIEESYESSLRGTNGKKTVRVDNYGNRTDTISETEPIPGNNIYLTIDKDVQEATEKAIKKGVEKISKGEVYDSEWGNYYFSKKRPGLKSGACAAMDVRTGEIISMASYPSYDPNLFTTGITNSDWNSLNVQSDDILAPRPLMNMAMQTAVQPGSTFKPISAMAALEKGFDPNVNINDTGYIDIGNQRFQCWIYPLTRHGHGYINMYQAIEVSCNYYFYCLALGEDPNSGKKLSTRVSVDDLEKTVKAFGLNETTGLEINIPNEQNGTIPSSSVKLTSTKHILRRKLRESLKDYIKEGLEKTDKDYNADIEEIVSWLDLGSSMNRKDVSNSLDKLGYEAEKVLKGKKINLTDQLKYNYLNQVEWKKADSLNVIIGQGQNAYTPLQMLRMTAILANRGSKLKATIVDKITNYDSSSLIYENEVVKEDSGFKKENFEIIARGMKMSAENGSVGQCFSVLPFGVASKTGTAEVDGIDSTRGEKYDNYTWFIAYAPIDDPKYAVVLMLPQGGAGSYGAPIVRDVLASLFDVRPSGQEIVNINANGHVEE